MERKLESSLGNLPTLIIFKRPLWGVWKGIPSVRLFHGTVQSRKQLGLVVRKHMFGKRIYLHLGKLDREDDRKAEKIIEHHVRPDCLVKDLEDGKKVKI